MTRLSPSLSEVADALRTGQLDLPDYLDALCDRIEAAEPELHALLPEPGRRARLQREAADLEARFPDPEQRPPLYGVPVGVKDIFRVDGFPTHAGSRLPPELFAGPEASSVTALRRVGALLLGKTVTTEFAYFAPGPTRNPRRPSHTPGGSSSGSAAAVAAGFCPLALGTQTTGSVIRPAAYCGVAGFKPTYSRIPTDGVIPFAPSLDHVGLFAPDAAGLVLVDAQISREWLSLPAGREAEAPVAVGVPEGRYLEQGSPEALEAFERQVARLHAAGIAVRRVPALEDIEAINQRHNRLAAAEMAHTHTAWFPAHGPLYHPITAALVREGQTVGAAEVAAARAGQAALRRELESQMVAESIRAWICPAATGPAPEGLASTGDPRLNLPWTHAGLPAVTLPAGAASNGLPLGLQLIAASGDDEWLLSFAIRLESLLASG
jgi:Asp-tRNA(Asn)/Glu-tRNA(Gln) amidotransferase A subunit family amidase